METNRMYRYARKLLDDIIKASESDKDCIEKVMKAIDLAKTKLEVLDEFDSMPPDLSGPGTLQKFPPMATDHTPSIPCSPLQYPEWPPDNTPAPKHVPLQQWPYQTWPYQGPGDCPWLEPTITCRGAAGTSAADKWPPSSSDSGKSLGSLLNGNTQRRAEG